MRVFIGLIVSLGLALALSASPLYAKSALTNTRLAGLLTHADALLVQSDDGQVRFTLNADRLMIPASTVKLVTTLMTLEQWGPDHHWQTEFALADQTLWVLGRGDPFLVSEEIESLAQYLAQQIEDPINQVIIDASYFHIPTAPGRTRVDDPYNAPLSAIAANFNTVNLRRTAQGFVSAEPQTPLTPLARQIGEQTLARKAWSLNTVERINVRSSSNAERYFGELLVAFLQVNHATKLAPLINIVTRATASEPTQFIPPQSARFFTYSNTQTWSQMVQGALKYSNNFITDHAFLCLGSEVPKTFNGAQARTREWLTAAFAWRDFSLVDGSGLSRDNRLSVRQLIDVLTRLKPFKSLLSEYSFAAYGAMVYAKTGTLNNVRSMAGYIEFAEQKYQFAFIFNRSTPWQHRENTLKALVQELALLTP